MRVENVECGACGGPVVNPSVNKCEYCGTGLLTLPYLESIKETLARILSDRGDKVITSILIFDHPTAVYSAEAWLDDEGRGVEIINQQQRLEGAKTVVVIDSHLIRYFRDMTPNPEK